MASIERAEKEQNQSDKRLKLGQKTSNDRAEKEQNQSNSRSANEPKSSIERAEKEQNQSDKISKLGQKTSKDRTERSPTRAVLGQKTSRKRAISPKLCLQFCADQSKLNSTLIQDLFQDCY